MPTPSRATPRTRSTTSRRKGPAATGQIALRYRSGAARKVRAALAGLGTVESYPAGSILILHRSPSVPAAEVRSAVKALAQDGLVEFATPVLRDRPGGSRRILTGEITVRLKSSAAARKTLASLKEEHGLRVERRNEFEPTQYVLSVPDPSGTRAREIARSLDSRSDVEFAAPNFLTGLRKWTRS